jgi:hypothetical protein
MKRRKPRWRVELEEHLERLYQARWMQDLQRDLRRVEASPQMRELREKLRKLEAAKTGQDLRKATTDLAEKMRAAGMVPDELETEAEPASPTKVKPPRKQRQDRGHPRSLPETEIARGRELVRNWVRDDPKLMKPDQRGELMNRLREAGIAASERSMKRHILVPELGPEPPTAQ